MKADLHPTDQDNKVLRHSLQFAALWWLEVHLAYLPVCVCAAGDPVLPPHPVYWDRWSVPREVQHRGVVSDRRPNVRGLHPAGTMRQWIPGSAESHIITPPR